LRLGYSVDQISKKLFINKDYLIAIEKGDYSIFQVSHLQGLILKNMHEYLN
jgi:cytoskeletal protein RodZ